MDIPFHSAKQLASSIRRRKIRCLELLDIYLARIEQYNPVINAIVFMDVDGARRRAKAADRALKRGDLWGPLHGVPMTVKESFNVVGMPTTWLSHSTSWPDRTISTGPVGGSGCRGRIRKGRSKTIKSALEGGEVTSRRSNQG